jgi:endonuclease/exonuclease/phosphatase (EEP) superfamily protein YafD
MGDFNVEPSSPIIAKIREKMVDAEVLFKNELLSFPSDKPRIKIDYIFASSDIEIISADIPEIIASDHRPHVAEIAF